MGEVGVRDSRDDRDEVGDKDSMPSLDRKTVVELRDTQDEIGGHKVVDCTHADDANQHEPATDVAERSCDAGGRKNGDPAVLAASHWIPAQVSRCAFVRLQCQTHTHCTSPPWSMRLLVS